MDGYACLLPCVNAEVMNRTPDGHSTPRGWLVSRPKHARDGADDDTRVELATQPPTRTACLCLCLKPRRRGVRGRPWLCLMCIRWFVCLLVSHPCCIVCVFHLLRFVCADAYQ